MRLLLDANVLFSAAHNPGGNARALFLLVEQRAVELVTSPFAVEEARRNIAVKYPERREELESLLASLELAVEPNPSLVALARAAGVIDKDAPILGAAIGARVDALVTGDRRHFGPLFGQLVEGVQVLLPAQALAQVMDSMNGA
jgi:predicted nucleic acid-binding protein